MSTTWSFVGNYVLQTALSVADVQQAAQIEQAINPHLMKLRYRYFLPFMLRSLIPHKSSILYICCIHLFFLFVCLFFFVIVRC